MFGGSIFLLLVELLPFPPKLQIRNVETNQCVDNMGRKENEKVGFFNCHGMGGNQVSNEGFPHFHFTNA